MSAPHVILASVESLLLLNKDFETTTLVILEGYLMLNTKRFWIWVVACD